MGLERRVNVQAGLFPWGDPKPSLGECCGCQRAPVERFRFNLIIEDAFTRQTHTQLLCRSCTQELLRTLIGQSVEATPQAELHRLDFLQGDAGWSMEQVA